MLKGAKMIPYSKTTPCPAAHTYIVHIWGVTPHPSGWKRLCLKLKRPQKNPNTSKVSFDFCPEQSISLRNSRCCLFKAMFCFLLWKSKCFPNKPSTLLQFVRVIMWRSRVKIMTCFLPNCHRST